ncbi:hypothetical protein [Thermomonas sp.]
MSIDPFSLIGIGRSAEAAGDTTGAGPCVSPGDCGAEHATNNNEIDAIANFMASPSI